MRALVLGDLHINGHDFLKPYVKDPSDLIYKMIGGIVRYAHKNNIRHLFQLGDVFHNPAPLQTDQKRWLDCIEHSGLMWYVQLGNHDIAENNKHSLILSEFVAGKIPNNLKIITQPTTFALDNVPICMLPWPHSKTLLKKPGLTFAHIMLKGCRLDSGTTAKSGVTITDPRGRWYIGDIHRHQVIGDWARYVGTPCQRTFGESLPKGFYDVIALIDDGGRLVVRDKFIIQKPPYELVNLAVDCNADLEKLKAFDANDLTLYKLKVSGGFKLPDDFRRNNPHIVDVDYNRAKAYAVPVASPETSVPEKHEGFSVLDPLAGLELLLAERGLTPEQQARGLKRAQALLAAL